MNIYIVIPAWNEEKNIEKVIGSLKDKYPNIVVVDDHSTDNTYEVLGNTSVFRLHHIMNLDQGGALQTGNEFALKQGADVIVHFDADGQHRADQIDKLVQPIINSETEVTLGSRFMNDSGGNIPWSKKFLILPAGKIVNFLFTGLKLTDAHNGYRAMSRKAAKKMVITQNGKAHATEVLQLIKKHKLKYKEVPVVVDYHEYGQNALAGFKILRDLLFKNFVN